MDEVRDDVVSWELAEKMLDTIDYLRCKLELWESTASKMEKNRIDKMMKLIYKPGRRLPEIGGYEQ